jgi:hypothetical protein
MYRELATTYWLEKAEAEELGRDRLAREPPPPDLTRLHPRAIVTRSEPRPARGEFA